MNSFHYSSVSVPRFGVREESKAFHKCKKLLPVQSGCLLWTSNLPLPGLLQTVIRMVFSGVQIDLHFGHQGVTVGYLCCCFSLLPGWDTSFFVLNKSNMFICTSEESDSGRRTVEVICNVNTLTSCWEFALSSHMCLYLSEELCPGIGVALYPSSHTPHALLLLCCAV